MNMECGGCGCGYCNQKPEARRGRYEYGAVFFLSRMPSVGSHGKVEYLIVYGLD